MNKKYLSTLSAILLSACFVTSCQKDEKIFTETPSERTENAMTDALTTLQSAVYGWEMVVYPSANKKYGGYSIFIRFDKNGGLESADEFSDPEGEFDQSLYTVDNSNGPTLVFNTYNPSIHRYSEPNSKIFPENKPVGADGDYSYRIISASKDKVILKGIRTNVEAVLTPLKTSGWSAIISAKQNAIVNFSITNAVMSYNGTAITGATMNSHRHLVFVYKGKKYDEPYRYTDTGIVFYQPMEIDGTKISELNNTAPIDDPVLEDPSGKLKIAYNHDPYAILIGGKWLYAEEGSTGRFLDAFSKVNDFVRGWGSQAGVEHNSVFFGQNAGVLSVSTSRFGYNIDKSTGKVSYADVKLVMKSERISDKEVKITYDAAASVADPNSWTNTLIQYRCAAYLAMGFSNIGTIEIPKNWQEEGGPTYFYKDPNSDGRTFTIEIEPNKAKPSWVKLVDKSDPKNTVKLISE